MSYFDRQVKVVVIDEAAGDRVTLRRLTHGERARCMSKAMTRYNMQAAEMEIDLAMLNLEMLKLSVVEWEGPGFGGAAVSGENIEALPTNVGDLLASAMNDWNSPLTASEKKG